MKLKIIILNEEMGVTSCDPTSLHSEAKNFLRWGGLFFSFFLILIIRYLLNNNKIIKKDIFENIKDAHIYIYIYHDI